MLYSLNFQIDCGSQQKAVALRETIKAILDADEDVALVDSGATQAGQTFEVIGVRDGNKPFKENVEATCADAAKAQVECKAKVVADVRVVI